VFPAGFWPRPYVVHHLYRGHYSRFRHAHCSVSSVRQQHLSPCVTDLAISYVCLRLQFNPSKTEFIWFGTRHNLAKLPIEYRSDFNGRLYSVRQSFSALMSSMISVSCWIVSYPCKATLARSRMFLSSEKATSDSELCHSRSHGPTRYTVTSFLALTTVTPCSLAFLHLCNAYKMKLLDLCSTLTSTTAVALAARQVPHHLEDRDVDVHILHDRCPSYLDDMGAFSTADSQLYVNSELISSQTRAAIVKRTRTQFSKRAFSVCGPNICNSLPPAVRNIDSYPAFRRALKSHLFYCAFIA